ncbi:hypothetical protein ACFOLD_04165 [Kocuria carniphila]|uniref:hypothetical protein n=1 Tax=Kocuria carniphila TaxID=262208 RepID=UPI00360AD3D2
MGDARKAARLSHVTFKRRVPRFPVGTRRTGPSPTAAGPRRRRDGGAAPQIF